MTMPVGVPRPSAAPVGGRTVNEDGAPTRDHEVGRAMAKLVARRVLLMVPSLLIVSIFTVGLVHLIPGGPAEARLGLNATSENIQHLNKVFGLDQPLYQQYWHWLTRALQGNFGMSLESGTSVTSQILNMLPITAELAGLGLLLAVLVAIPLGTFAAVTKSRAGGALATTLSGLGLAIPDFFLAILLVEAFAVHLHVLPILGFVGFASNPGQNLRYVTLPVITLAVGGAAILVRQTRAAMLDVLSSDYVRTARAMGVRERRIVWRYALRNALPGLVTIIGLLGIGMLGATVILEKIFVIPGLGNEIIIAIQAKDYTMLQGIIVFFALIVLFLNLVVDLVNSAISPSYRVGGGE